MPVCPRESIAVIVNVEVPATVGVPDILPLGESVSPDGSAFNVTLKV